MRTISLLWAIPLSIASFVFYKTMRWLMRRLIVLNARVHSKRAPHWNVLSAESLKMKLALPGIMATGPRWNTHAIIAAAGPFAVRQSVSVDVAAAQRSAKAWTLVCYTFPDQRTAAHIGSIDAPLAGHEPSVQLAPGHYTVALRYYRWSENVQLPAISVDGTPLIPSQTIARSTNDFYVDLAKRRGLLYLWMHYYMYTLLHLRRLLPRSFIEREFLPMGNPETRFYYGALECGEALRFRIDPALLATHDIYVTIYTRDSFPAYWHQVQESQYTTSAARESGFYLVRIHQNVSSPADGADSLISIQTAAEDVR